MPEVKVKSKNKVRDAKTLLQLLLDNFDKYFNKTSPHFFRPVNCLCYLNAELKAEGIISAKEALNILEIILQNCPQIPFQKTGFHFKPGAKKIRKQHLQNILKSEVIAINLYK